MSEKKTKEMNIMITNVSTITRYLKNKYADVSGTYNDIEGYMTNEPPIKYLIKKLKADAAKLDNIILIESNETNKKVVIEPKTYNKDEINQFEEDYGNDKWSSVEILKDKIEKFCQNEKIEVPSFDDVKLSDDTDKISDTDVVTAVMDVYKKLVDEAKKVKRLNVYIEANGGVRYVLVMLLSVMNILEKVQPNIKLQATYSMIYNKRTEEDKIPILDTSMTYASIELFSAMNEFIYYGRTKALKGYFEKRKEMKKEPDSETMEVFCDIEKCIERLQNMADNMQLCRTEQIIEDFYGEENIKKVLNAFDEKYKDKKDADSQIFRNVIENISKEYEDIYNGEDKNKFLNLPQIIQWCLDKDFVQQALTLCSERLPQYLIENGTVRISNELKEYVKNSSKKNNKAQQNEFNYYVLTDFLKNDYKTLINYIKIEEMISMYVSSMKNYNRKNNDEYQSILEEWKNKFAEYTEKEKNIPLFVKEQQKDFVTNLTESQKEKCLEYIKKEKNQLKEYWEKQNPTQRSAGGKLKSEWIVKSDLQEIYPLYVEYRKNFLKKLEEEQNIDWDSHREDAYKYTFFDLFDDKHLYTDDMEHFISIMVLYGILKGQRNLSNHASQGSTDEEKYVLDMNQIKSLIRLELEKIAEYNGGNN